MQIDLLLKEKDRRIIATKDSTGTIIVSGVAQRGSKGDTGPQGPQGEQGERGRAQGERDHT